jgi:hypothetical protein
MEKTIHQGRNIKRFREMLGIKHEALAVELGDDWNHGKVSLLENKEVIEEEKAVNIIANTFNNDASAYVENYKCSFNPIDKIVELYEALVKSEKEKVELLTKLLETLS